MVTTEAAALACAREAMKAGGFQAIANRLRSECYAAILRDGLAKYKEFAHVVPDTPDSHGNAFVAFLVEAGLGEKEIEQLQEQQKFTDFCNTSSHPESTVLWLEDLSLVTYQKLRDKKIG